MIDKPRDRFQVLADALLEQSFKDNKEELAFAFEKLLLGKEVAIKAYWDERLDMVKMKFVETKDKREKQKRD